MTVNQSIYQSILAPASVVLLPASLVLLLASLAVLPASWAGLLPPAMDLLTPLPVKYLAGGEMDQTVGTFFIFSID